MPELIAPTTHLHGAWLDAHAEWGPGAHEDGFGLAPTDEVDSSAGFTAWVKRLTNDEDTTYRWIAEDNRVLGGIALRHSDDDYVKWAGHIGFGIRPTARGRGLAAWALGRMLNQAQVLGMDRVLVVCAMHNIASAKTIERAGGIFEEVRDTRHGPARRYWIKLPSLRAHADRKPTYRQKNIRTPLQRNYPRERRKGQAAPSPLA